MNTTEHKTKMTQEDKFKLSRGELFCTTADVWKATPKEFHAKHWDAFWRKGDVSIRVRQKKDPSNKPLDPYKFTLDAMKNGLHPAPEKSTRSESTATDSPSAKKEIWPQDIAGNCVQPGQEIAHLLPAGAVVHEEWFGVGAAVMGLPRDSSVSYQLMATRGVSKQEQEESPESPRADGKLPAAEADDVVTSSGRKKRKLENVKYDEESIPKSLDSTKTIEARRRLVSNTGVVHFVYDKIRLDSQKILLDGKVPTLLIVPCMTLERANAWRGEAYKALVLTGFPDEMEKIPIVYTEEYMGMDTSRIAELAYQKSGMSSKEFQEKYESSPEITPKEKETLLEKARQGLEDAVLGLSEYVKGLKGLDEEEWKSLQPSNQKLLQERSDAFSKFKEVLVPGAKGDDLPDKPLLFVEFGTAGDIDSHPAPDPELLLAKAAIVWGKLIGMTILAGGGLDEEDCDSLDEAAEADFYHKFRTPQALKGTLQVPTEISVETPALST